MTVGIIGFAILLGLMVIGMPIGLAMALTGFVGVWYMASFDAALLGGAKTIFTMISSYELATLPLFVLMADIVFQAGFGKTLFDSAYKWAGRLPGGPVSNRLLIYHILQGGVNPGKTAVFRVNRIGQFSDRR